MLGTAALGWGRGARGRRARSAISASIHFWASHTFRSTLAYPTCLQNLDSTDHVSIQAVDEKALISVDQFRKPTRGPWRAPSDRRPPPPLPCRAFRCPKLRSRRAFPLLLAARVRVRPPPPLWRCPGDLRIQCGSALLAVRFDQRAARPIAAACTGHGRVERPGQGLGPPPALPTA